MSSLSHRYRDLGSPAQGDTPPPSAPQDDLEEVQLASFETGYQAGWEDAVKAHESDSGRAAIDVAQNLQDLSFTHREAYLKLSAAMKPLMTQIVEKLLPGIAHRVLGTHILQQLSELMDARADNAIEIAVSPENLDDIQSLLSELVRVPFSLVAEPTLTAGQAYLRVNTTEREINLKAVLSGISEALDAFYEQTNLELTNG